MAMFFLYLVSGRNKKRGKDCRQRGERDEVMKLGLWRDRKLAGLSFLCKGGGEVLVP